MDFFTILTILIVLAALFGYINVRVLKLPVTIGLMVVSIIFSILILAVGYINPTVIGMAENMIGQIDFYELLMEGMLSFLLFAGARHVDFGQLKDQRAPIIRFATLGVLTSTFLVGGMSFVLLQMLGMGIPFI